MRINYSRYNIDQQKQLVPLSIRRKLFLVFFYPLGLKLSFRATARLKTRWPGAESLLSTAK